jgi:hypothetical protein
VRFCAIELRQNDCDGFLYCHPADLVDAAFREQSEGEGDVGYGIGADEVTSENRWQTKTGGVAVSELVDLAHNGVD